MDFGDLTKIMLRFILYSDFKFKTHKDNTFQRTVKPLAFSNAKRQKRIADFKKKVTNVTLFG
jgi:hypothetical protein